MPGLQPLFRAIPSMDRVLARLAGLQEEDFPAARFLADAPRALLRQAAGDYWAGIREKIRAGEITSPDELALEVRLDEMLAFLEDRTSPKLRRVLNGTGVVIHTNTGRSVLPSRAMEALERAATGNVTLEFDRRTGGRGSRHALLRDLVRALTGAEDALAVNNNAAGVLLTLDSFCRGREVIISRGELVEIGGSFRIPDVMEATGARLREVGATNRTHPEDYLRAIGPETAAIVRVHSSNFRIIGFHSAVPTAELAAMAHARGLLLLNDLGSGSLMDLTDGGLPAEPTVPQAIADGSDIVLFSGDKLLGGPQAGLIAGRADLVARLRTNPLLRALRCGKLAYAALEATLRLYLDPRRAREEIPTLRRLLLPPEVLAARARSLAEKIRALCGPGLGIELIGDSSRTGGGAFPEHPLPTTLVALRPGKLTPQALRDRLLRLNPVLIGRLDHEAFCLDPRTLEPDEFSLAAALTARAFGTGGI